MGFHTITCDICEQKFQFGYLLTAHKKIHKRNDLYFCDICEIYFDHKYDISNHYKSLTHLDKMKSENTNKNNSEIVEEDTKENIVMELVSPHQDAGKTLECIFFY